jgi:hypothetical protein
MLEGGGAVVPPKTVKGDPAKAGSPLKLGRKGQAVTRPFGLSVPRLLCLATRRETGEE